MAAYHSLDYKYDLGVPNHIGLLARFQLPAFGACATFFCPAPPFDTSYVSQLDDESKEALGHMAWEPSRTAVFGPLFDAGCTSRALDAASSMAEDFLLFASNVAEKHNLFFWNHRLPSFREMPITKPVANHTRSLGAASRETRYLDKSFSRINEIIFKFRKYEIPLDLIHKSAIQLFGNFSDLSSLKLPDVLRLADSLGLQELRLASGSASHPLDSAVGVFNSFQVLPTHQEIKIGDKNTKVATPLALLAIFAFRNWEMSDVLTIIKNTQIGSLWADF